MKNHKVVDIKITYEPENMGDVKALESKIDSFLNSVKDTKGVRISAKRHNVEVDVMLDEYGLEVN
jgi:hypothetical protein